MFSDQERRFAIANSDFFYALMIPYLLQDGLYMNKLLSIMICVLVSVMLLVRICLSTLRPINLWSGSLSSAFAWGQARSKLGGSWYVQFASLFCIIIYCYSLIYFIFRYDTYVISSIFACLMISMEFTAGAGILLEKWPSRHYIWEDQKITEK